MLKQYLTQFSVFPQHGRWRQLSCIYIFHFKTVCTLLQPFTYYKFNFKQGSNVLERQINIRTFQPSSKVTRPNPNVFKSVRLHTPARLHNHVGQRLRRHGLVGVHVQQLERAEGGGGAARCELDLAWTLQGVRVFLWARELRLVYLWVPVGIAWERFCDTLRMVVWVWFHISVILIRPPFVQMGAGTFSHNVKRSTATQQDLTQPLQVFVLYKWGCWISYARAT